MRIDKETVVTLGLLVVLLGGMGLLALHASKSRPARGPHAHAGAGHGTGGHRSVVSLGDDEYHAEVTATADTLLLFVLGKRETDIEVAAAEPLPALARKPAEAGSRPVTFAPKPQPGDPPGLASRFEATLPADLRGGPLEVTVPHLAVGGRRFRFAAHVDGSGAMPGKVVDAEEEELYLWPGGLYTAADIVANGRQTASQKYKGFKAAHDHNPRPGDRICPVTRTKVHPDCGWVVGGKTYLFCCPPCVDEFVKQAKERPDTVKPPEGYTK